MSLTRPTLPSVLVALSLAVASALAACGDDEQPSAGRVGTGAQVPKDGKKGGVLTQLGASDVDFLDPGKTYFTGGYQVAYATNRMLYSYKPGDEEAVPDMAEGEPEISPDKQTITVKLKDKVRFGPPVNRTITAKDVKYAFERAFSKNVDGQYTFYFDAIEGVPEQPTDGVQPISGIQAPDDRTLVLKLTRPVAASVAAALVMPITAPVPPEYARKFDAKSPSTYNTHVVASGPYMVRNDAKGNTIGYKPRKSIELIRNPNWDESTDYRPAYLDAIKLTTNESDMSVAARQILRGSKMAIDTNPPAAELKLAVTKFEDQYAQVPSGQFRWFPMNTTVKPLDDINVRKAIIAGFDRAAALKSRGGDFVSTVATHFIPPGIPGFEQAGGEQGGGQDFLAQPRGNVDLAAAYLKKAGYPSGKYTGKDELLMITANADPGRAQAQVARAQMQKLGFKVRLRQVPQDAVYNEYCQVPARKVAICGTAAWGKDFNDPQSMLEPTFKGANIQRGGGNNNLAQLDVPAIDAAMDRAGRLSGDERYAAWGKVDQMIVDQAPAVPFMWDKTTIVWSKDVVGAVNGYYLTLDYSFTSLKE